MLYIVGVRGSRVAHNIENSQSMKIPGLGLSILYVIFYNI